MRPKYQKKWQQYREDQKLANLDSIPRPVLYDFMKSLIGDDLYEFVEDILINNKEAIAPIFAQLTGRQLRVEEVAFDWLMDTPVDFIQEQLTQIFDVLFIKALDGQYENKDLNETVLNRIKSVTANKKAGLSTKLIMDEVEFDSRIDLELKIELLMLLAQFNSPEADYTFWSLFREKMPEEPLFGAAVIAAYKRERPELAIEILTDYLNPALQKYTPKPEHLKYFSTPLDTALYYFLEKPDASKQEMYHKIKAEAWPQWIAELLDEILSRPHFRHVLKQWEDVMPEDVFLKLLAAPEENNVREVLQLHALQSDLLLNVAVLSVQRFFIQHFEPGILRRFRPLFMEILTIRHRLAQYLLNHCKVWYAEEDATLEDPLDAEKKFSFKSDAEIEKSIRAENLRNKSLNRKAEMDRLAETLNNNA